MFKKMTFGLFVMLLSVNLYAGDYDGIWQITDGSDILYVTINQNGNSLILVGHKSDLTEWWADSATISGNIATTKTLLTLDPCTYESTITFSSSSRATLVDTSVTGDCGDSAVGDTYEMTKIF